MSVFVCVCVFVCTRTSEYVLLFYPDMSLLSSTYNISLPFRGLCIRGTLCVRDSPSEISSHPVPCSCVCLCVCRCVCECIMQKSHIKFNVGCSCSSTAVIGGFRHCTNALWDLASQNNITPTMSYILCQVSL